MGTQDWDITLTGKYLAIIQLTIIILLSIVILIFNENQYFHSYIGPMHEEKILGKPPKTPIASLSPS